MAEATKAEPTKLVKIRVLRDCMVEGKVVTPGTILEVAPTVAAKLCDKGYKGYEPFYGNKPEIQHLNEGVDLLARKPIFKAERIA